MKVNRKIFATSLVDGTKVKFNSAMEASEKLGVNLDGVYTVLRGAAEQAKGYFFEHDLTTSAGVLVERVAAPPPRPHIKRCVRCGKEAHASLPSGVCIKCATLEERVQATGAVKA